MTSQQVAHALETLEERRVPPGLDLWPRVRASAAAHQRVGPSRTARAVRVGSLALAAVLLFAFGATAYAKGPVYESLIRLFEPRATSPVEPAEQGVPLDVSQTVANVTVSVEWAYADAGRILVAYTVRSADGRRYSPQQVSLAGAGGAQVPQASGYGVTGASDMLDVALPAGEGAYVGEFAAPDLGAAPGEALALHLEMRAEELLLPATDTASSGEPAAGPSGPGSVLLDPLPNGESVGPFLLAFSVPVDPGAE